MPRARRLPAALRGPLMAELRRTLNPEQQDAISGTGNMVVTASAGTGKTAVLVERYLRLVSDGVPLERILALTFTRKAAAEMRDRIVTELVGRSTGTDSEQLDLERIRIGTLDSFCLEIIRQNPGALQLPPEIGMLEEGGDERTLDFARDFLLSNAEDPGIAGWNPARSLDDLLQLGLLPLARSRPLSRVPDASELLERDDEELAEQFAKVRETAQRTLSEILALLSTERSDSKTWERAGEYFPAVQSQLDNAGDWTEEVSVLASAVFPLPGGKITKEPLISLKELLTRWKEMVVFPAAEQQPDIENRPRREAVYRLLGRFLGEYSAHRRDQGLLGFQDLLSLALDLLLSQEDLLRRVRNGISACLIDEFQDNNSLQRDLLYLIAGREEITTRIPMSDELQPDRLFFVGDAKQSIYRFRGADVSVFNGMASSLEEQGGRTVQLTRTYRLSPPLVAFTNHIFSRVFPEQPEEWDTSFAPAIAGVANSAAATDEVCARLILGVRDDDREPNRWTPEDEEAEAGVRALKEEAEARDIPYADCAILLPTYRQQHAWERALRRHGVPFSAAIDRSILAEAPANDLWAVLRTICGPADPYAWAVLVRGPFTALSPEAASALMQRGPITSVEELPPGLSAVDQERMGGLLGRISELRRADLSAVELLDRAWYDLGYRWFVLERLDLHPYLASFTTLRTEAARFSGRSPRAFLDWLEPELAGGQRLDGDEEPGRGNALSILSIHKSKGLEYRLVLVAGLGTAENTRESRLVQDSPDRIRVHLGSNPPGYLWSSAARAAEQAVDAELRRKLYVALTRAKDSLILCAYFRGTNKQVPELSYLYHVLSAIGLPTSREDLLHNLEAGLKSLPDIPQLALSGIPPQEGPWRARQLVDRDQLLAISAREPAELRVMPDTFAATTLQDLHQTLRHQSGELDAGPPSVPEPLLPYQPSGHVQATEFGTRVHELLDSLIRRDLGAAVSLHGPEPQEPGEGSRTPEIQASLDLVAEVYSASELPVLLGQMDLIELELPALGAVPLPDGRRWKVRAQLDCVGFCPARIVIVDFKTDAELRADSYRLQLSLYAAFAQYLRPPELPENPGAEVELYRYAARSGRLDRIMPYSADGPLQQELGRIAAHLANHQTR